MRRRVLIAPVLFALAACQPQQPPRTAASAAPQGSIDLPATALAHPYEAAIKPGDDARTPRSATVARAPARPPVNALTEREKQAIARWDREEAALNYDAPPLGLRPPPRTGVKLAMPADAALPRPSLERAAPVTRSDTVLPPPDERRAPVTPEPVKASAEPVSPPAVPPPTAPPAVRPEPPPVTAAPAAFPTASAPPQQTAAVALPIVPAPAAKPRAATAADKPIPRPTGEPAATVTFAPRSADLSGGDRLLLEHVAHSINTRRLRQVLLYGYGGASNPVEARKLALARVLAVHAALIDLGLKADIEIGDFSQASDASPDRVDVMLRY